MNDRQERLVEDHRFLVERQVDRKMHYVPNWVDRDELVGCGMLALVQSAERFDPSLGVPFAAFAQIRIDGAIRDALRSGDWLPVRVRAAQRRITAAEARLRAESNETPDEAAIASAAGISLAELRRALQQSADGELLSLEDQLERHGHNDYSIISRRNDDQPEESVLDACLVERMRSMIRFLSDAQRTALVGTYLEGRTGVELSEELHVSQSRVSQLRREALDTLRVWLDSVPAGGSPGDDTPPPQGLTFPPDAAPA